MRIHTGIGGELLLVKTLDEVERHLGRIAEFLVAIHLERSEVIKLRWQFLACLLLYAGDLEGFAFNEREGCFAFFLVLEFALSGGEGGVAVDGRKHPIGFGLEIVYLLLAVHNECQSWCLYTSDGEYLAILAVLQSIETRGVHAENPVADGT